MKRILLLASLLVSFQVLFAQPRTIQRHFYGLTLGETYTQEEVVGTLSDKGLDIFATEWSDGQGLIAFDSLSFGEFDWTGGGLQLFGDKYGVLAKVSFHLAGETPEDLLVVEDKLVSLLTAKYGKPRKLKPNTYAWIDSASVWESDSCMAVVQQIESSDGSPVLTLGYALVDVLIRETGLDEL